MFMHPKRLMIDINKIRVASPCSAGWETMSGDERARHCESCKLNVYNIAGMTNAEVRHLISNRDGRLCIRLFRRTDGTVLTKDCPVGLRAYQRRVAKFAGATLSVLFSLVGLVAGQKDEGSSEEKGKNKVERKVDRTAFSGAVTDLNGAVIPEVTIKLFAADGKKSLRATKSNNDGRYELTVAAGTYRLVFRRKHFKTLVVDNAVIIDGRVTNLNVKLEVVGVSVWVGIIAEDSLIDMNSSSVTTKITRRQIDGLPF
jgi:5-hydroxyisourate hydrolase-like protein (transthyretin family)